MSLCNHFASLLHHSWNQVELLLGSFRPSTTLLESLGAAETSILAERSTEKKGLSSRSTKETNIDLIVELSITIGYAIVTGLLARWLIDRYLTPQQLTDTDQPSSKEVYKGLQRILQKRNRGNTQLMQLNSYELQIANEILDPDDIETNFAEIGGLDSTKTEIYELAVLPLVHPELFTGKLVQPCKGILLYGRPGTGKTMLAKALAKESEAVFIPLQLSKLLNKWVGESNKLIAGAFSLAHKLQPAILFIDEIDTFLKANAGEGAQYLDTIKSEFLILWDGVATSTNSRVMVLGATNKPQTIDPAIQRRMPRTFHVPLPNVAGRQAILNIFLQEEKLSMDARACLPELAKATVNYSGSDLKELCKAAAMVGIQERTAEYARKRVMGESVALDQTIGNAPMRPISKDDLLSAFSKVQRTGAAAQAYGRQTAREDAAEQESESPAVDAEALRNLTRFLHSMSNLSVGQSRGDGTDIPDLN
jgi:SpoVK/Ycf46/Vps4 family AAA+-type ATPase